MKRKLISLALSISLVLSAMQLPVFAGEARTVQTLSGNGSMTAEEIPSSEREAKAANPLDVIDHSQDGKSTDHATKAQSALTEKSDENGQTGVDDRLSAPNTATALSNSEAPDHAKSPDSSNAADAAEATKDNEATGESKEELLCICKEQCSQDQIDETCPVCSSAGADLTACAGTPVRRMMARTMTLPAAVNSSTIYVGTSNGQELGTKANPYGTLNKAVQEASNGTTIILMAGAWCDPDGSNPLTIDKQVTIQGDPDSSSRVTLNSRVLGYVLEADVTLKNFDFNYAFTEINGIFANGHKLIIDNVGNNANEKQRVDIYAGGLGINATPSTGSVIEISGSQTVLGTVYGGGFSQNGSQNWGNNTPASVISINDNVSLVGISASGVRKVTQQGAASQYFPQITKGSLTIKLTDVTGTLAINGMLDNTVIPENKANVEVTSTGNPMTNLSFSNIGKLTAIKGKLIPKKLDERVDISIQSGATLDLGPAIDEMNNTSGSYQNYFNINSFEGGGTLQFKEEYSLVINGNVSGTTDFQSTLLQTSQDTSGYVTAGKVYIDTPVNTADHAFTFTPRAEQSTYRLEKVIEGNWARWTIKDGGSTPPAAKQDMTQAVINVNATFTYNGTAQTPQAGAVTVTLNGNPVPSAAYDISAANNTNAGEAAITVTAKADSNYTGTATGTYRIEARPITVSATPQTIFYGQKAAQPTYTISGGTLANGESLSGSPALNGNSITQGTLTNQNNPNYNITFNGANVTVKETTPAIDISSSHTVQKPGGEVEVTVKVSNPYNSALQDYGTPALTWRIGNGAKQAISNSRFTIPPGTAKDTVITVEAAIAQVAGKYAAKTASIQVTVTDKAIADDKLVLNTGNLEYGAAPNFQVQFTGTTVGNPKTTLTYSNDSGASFKALADLQNPSGYLPAGIYQVKARYEDDTQLGELTKTFEVTKKRLTLGMNASGVTKTYDGTTRVEGTSPTLSIRGMATGDSPSLNEGAVTYTYENANAGTDKTIVASGIILNDTAVNKNYTVPTTASASGAVILPREVDLSFSGNGTSHKAGEKVSLTVQVKDKSAAPLPQGAVGLATIIVTDGDGITAAMGNAGNGLFTGSYTIPSGKQPGDSIILKAVTKDSNYKEATAQITLTVVGGSVIPPVNPNPGAKMDIEIKPGISQLPGTLKTALGITTAQELESIMREKITQAVNISTENTTVYDVSLLISRDNGVTWEKATKDSFPKGGLEVVLPYPAGTSKNTHDFTVVHMFTQEMNGYMPGDIEMPAVIKDDTGIRFTVNGLSPISLGWQKLKKTENQPVGNGGNTGSGSSEESSSPTPINTVYNETEFWKNVEGVLYRAKDGDTVKVNAGGYNYMPQYIMKILKEKGTITLELSWNGGGTITIPAGKALDMPVEQYALTELEKTDLNQPQQMVLPQQSQASAAGSSASRSSASTTANTVIQKKAVAADSSVPAVQEDSIQAQASDQLLTEASPKEDTIREESGSSDPGEDHETLAEAEENTVAKQTKQGFGIQWLIIGGVLIVALGAWAVIAIKRRD